MNNLINFNNDEFGEITVINQNGEYWFIGKEIATKLGYKDTVNAIKTHIDNEDKLVVNHHLHKNRKMTIINESGLFSLILSSKLKGAKKFQRWVTKEILPTLREYGYIDITETPINRLLHVREKSKEMTKNFNRLFALANDYQDKKGEIGFMIANSINKFYQAITSYTASELLYYRVDHEKDNVGLQTFNGKKMPTKADVQNAKNTLTKEELGYLDSFMDISVTRVALMNDFDVNELIKTIDGVGKFVSNEYHSGKGKVTRKDAIKHAIGEHNKYKENIKIEKQERKELK
jgi:prophage antirepressor-like protein